MIITLYKRNAQGKPIEWSINTQNNIFIEVTYGLYGGNLHTEYIRPTQKSIDAEIQSMIKAKRKEGYKCLADLYDNAPKHLDSSKDLYNYLNTYLPKDNTHADGNFIPMLCKTLEDNKPFEKHSYSGQWKINGERCIITAFKDDDLFQTIHLNYRSREGIDWTDKLNYLDEYLLPNISQTILDMMIEEGVGLDGELYLPGYGINEINSFIKNTELPQHYQLQYWLYDICIPDMSAIARHETLKCNFNACILPLDITKEGHLNNKQRLVLLPNYYILDFQQAVYNRDKFIDLGFEGLVIRDDAASYQFGGKRNQAMMKFKRKEDGKFKIIDIIPEGKRIDLPKFICKNDINDEEFEVTLNVNQDTQRLIFINRAEYIGKLMLVEYRERSGIKQVPFHAKGIKIILNNES